MMISYNHRAGAIVLVSPVDLETLEIYNSKKVFETAISALMLNRQSTWTIQLFQWCSIPKFSCDINTPKVMPVLQVLGGLISQNGMTSFFFRETELCFMMANTCKHIVDTCFSCKLSLHPLNPVHLPKLEGSAPAKAVTLFMWSVVLWAMATRFKFQPLGAFCSCSVWPWLLGMLRFHEARWERFVRDFEKIFGIFWDILWYFGIFWDILWYFGIFWDIWVPCCFTIWDILGSLCRLICQGGWGTNQLLSSCGWMVYPSTR